MIKLENVTKVYPGQQEPAVSGVSIEVPEGETCVLIGPSGCGKTTTLKMVNRLIEPTDGKIFLDGENILDRNPVQLRREIGYVIQQIGLFPHMTIRDNIATVPKLLGWSDSRIDERVDELLSLTGMEPATFRERYPRELSGGQRQRVGVARALAADPPVMLMDEPFGAIDPITRDRLQNEFLRLQSRIKKTIMFVTHDIDEAIKMGTLLCILQVGGSVEQFASPKKVLSSPANDFVSDFVGADRGLKRLNLVRVHETMREGERAARYDATGEELAARMQREDIRSLMVLDDEDQLLGYIGLETARKNPNQKAGDIHQGIIASTEAEATMKDAFSEMLSYGISVMPVLEDGKFLGIVTANDAQRLIEEAGNEEE
ncbi:MAG: betaine/proline/choline family ABC transporter ATP-binding protein [Anaerolineales bacterium]|nr:betaine/proline/choline family ABC transporter ATP-binding protein [Anaerolineales bacterium]